jgi:hypothetical protein
MKSKSVIRLELGTPTERTWNGRDDNRGHHHGWIPHDQSVITLALNWKTSKNGELYEVGRYKINLPELETEGFVRSSNRRYFLRFQHKGNSFVIAVNCAGPYYPLD